MNKVRKKISKSTGILNNRLKGWCERISPDNRLVMILGAFVLFGIGTIWILVDSIRKINRGGDFMRIEHIRHPEIRKPSLKDSISFGTRENGEVTDFKDEIYE